MRNWIYHLYFWVLVATLLGGAIGFFAPTTGESLKIFGEGFIALVKVFIGPIVFCTVVSGIAGAGDMKKVGRIGGKSILYFEIVSSLALVLGLGIVNVLQPGRGLNVDVASLDSSSASLYTEKLGDLSAAGFVMHIIPKTFLDAFTGSGDLLQVLLMAILFGWATNHLGEKAKPAREAVSVLSQIFSRIMNAIMYLAPIGAGGAMAFTIGKYGLKALVPLAALVGTFYLTCAAFVFLVLGAIAAWTGFSIFRYLIFIRREILLVLATSSSESALVPMMERLEELGCSKAVTGLVIPSGYSFNLDGTNIYLTMAALFIAQACNIELSLTQQASLLAVAVISSKGAAGVTGAGFITLAATLAVVPTVPVAGLALILGVDRFMSEARAITNVIGNGVATLAISAWENELDRERLRAKLNT